MWNGGLCLMRNHINGIFLEGQECGLPFLPKITNKHVYLTSYSVMNVRLAAQVLRTTVSKVFFLIMDQQIQLEQRDFVQCSINFLIS